MGMKREELDEHLEGMWYLFENAESDIESFKRRIKGDFDKSILETLRDSGYITMDGDKVKLTEQGYVAAGQVIRRHRLAERLLTDVLGMELGDIETGACEFEHVIASELVESICTLLGHPRECPHGSQIPEGECCRQARKTVSSAVVPLPEVEVGKEIKVAYINTKSNSRMHKLSHFGVVPGSLISIHQKYPSFVIKCGNSQIALEEEIAKEIYVWYIAQPLENVTTSVPGSKRWRFGRRE
jgi:DtxR family Mn-dependent transcriptional regulator